MDKAGLSETGGGETESGVSGSVVDDEVVMAVWWWVIKWKW